jgi:hypothetical protein
LVGSDTASASGITVTTTTPVLDLCRALVGAGHDPGSRLLAYRGGTLSLNVRAIGEAAQFEINGKGNFVRREGRIAPPIAPTAAPYGKGPPAQVHRIHVDPVTPTVPHHKLST